MRGAAPEIKRQAFWTGTVTRRKVAGQVVRPGVVPAFRLSNSASSSP